MMPIEVEQRHSGLADVLATDLGVSRELARELIDSDERFQDDLRPIRISTVRRAAGSLLIGMGRVVGGRSLTEHAGSPA
ncbi:MAG: hypothetical protein ACRDJH_12685 [Thermomicrobiales bacterium]